MFPLIEGYAEGGFHDSDEQKSAPELKPKLSLNEVLVWSELKSHQTLIDLRL